MIWAQFLISSLFVVLAGLLIGRVSGEIGERLHLGRAWAGTVLISFATTLPELVTTVTLCMRGAVGIAIGGILGSIAFNLFILVVIDFFDRDPIYPRLSMNHLVTGLLGCILLAILASSLSLELSGIASGVPSLGAVGWTSIFILGAYSSVQYLLVRLSRVTSGAAEPIRQDTIFNKFSNGALLSVYAGIALVIFVSANQLGISAEKIAGQYGLGATFTGATLLGIVTSLPEISNAIACARKKEFDLAVGNILGANALVIAVFAVAGFFVAEGPLVSRLDSRELLSSITMAGLSIVMQGIALTAIAVRSAHQISRISFASMTLAMLYAFILVTAYRFHG